MICMLFNHFFIITWRELRKNKIRSLIRILSMAIGFVAFILGGYWWYWENHFDNFQPQNDRLYAIVTYGMVRNPDGGESGLNQLHKDDYAWFKNNIPEIEKSCSVCQTWYVTEDKQPVGRYSVLVTGPVFFQLFYHRFLDGGYEGVVPDSKSVILTRRTALKFCGTVQCSGQTISLGDDGKGKEQVFQVAGVIEDYPSNTEFLFDFIILGESEFNHMSRAGVYVLLDEKADVEKVKQKIRAHKSIAVDPYGIERQWLWRFELTPLADLHFTCHPQLGNRFRNIRILALAGVLVLISALMNHLVLFVGYQQKKEREYITRVSLGSSRKALVSKMYIELFLPILMAFIVALCCIELLFPIYCDYTAIQGEDLMETWVSQINRKELLGEVFQGMFYCMLIFGGVSAIPVWFVIQGQQRKISNRQYSLQAPLFFRRSLIVGQIFIGTLFFMASLGMYKQLYFLKHKDLGIDLEQVIQVSLGNITAKNLDVRYFAQELKACPWIREVTMTEDPVLSPHGIFYGNRLGFIAVEGRDYDTFKQEGEEDYLFAIDENFFDFFRIPFKAGTGISAENPKDFVVNETGFRELGFPDLLQRSLREKDGNKVSGIIRDYHYAPIQYPIHKVFFYVERDEYQLGLENFRNVYVRYAPENEEKVREYITSLLSKYDRGEVPKEQQLIRLSDVIDEFNRPEVVIFTLFSVLAALCILVSSFGIFSLVALAAEQRKKEIAIRKVNGATFINLLYLFLKEYLWLVAIGGVIALLVGYRLMQNWLETYASHTRLGILLFVGVGILVTCIVGVAVAIQVKKAASANPSAALKEGD